MEALHPSVTCYLVRYKPLSQSSFKLNDRWGIQLLVTLKLKDKVCHTGRRAEVALSVTGQWVSRWMTMKFFACVALLLLTVEHSESACYVVVQDPSSTTGCIDEADRTLHRPGESWLNSNCERCSCSDNSLKCCQAYSTPQGYPDDCTAVFDRLNCRYRVHKINNPSVKCHAMGAVGK
ncbi:beta-microseminoprotein-like [Heptranchias perlo]|uniref:beta-microseminoprotein-like n=1 Tax=Heptranchias perlo TaxID=212740 RepID=UPI003559CFDE